MTKFSHLTREERAGCIGYQLREWDLPVPFKEKDAPFDEAVELVLFNLVVKIKELEDIIKDLKK